MSRLKIADTVTLSEDVRRTRGNPTEISYWEVGQIRRLLETHPAFPTGLPDDAIVHLASAVVEVMNP